MARSGIMFAVAVVLVALQLGAANSTSVDPAIVTEDGNLRMESGADAFVVLDGTRHSLASLFDTVGQLSNQVTEQADKIRGQEITIKEHTGSISSQGNTIIEQAKTISKNTGRISELDQKLASAAKSVANQAALIKKLQASVASQGRQMTANTGRVQGVETVANAVATKIGTIAPVATDNKNDIASIQTKVNGLTSTVSKISSSVSKNEDIVILAWTNRPGTYNIRAMFDAKRRAGLASHTYRCFVRTNNGAHWKGATFTIIANYYMRHTHSSFPHRIYDVTRLDAGSSGGCSAGMTSFVSNSNTGYFTFSPGNCRQRITLTCRLFI